MEEVVLGGQLVDTRCDGQECEMMVEVWAIGKGGCSMDKARVLKEVLEEEKFFSGVVSEL